MTRSVLPALGVLALTLVSGGLAWGQLRVVTYNTLDGPTTGIHDNGANLQTIFGAIANQSVGGIARRPAVIVLQEQTASSHTNIASLLNTLYGAPTGTFVALQPGGQPNDDRQAFVYDSSQVTLIGSASSIPTGEVRPVLRAQFRPVGYTTSAANFWVYGAHLMATDPAGRANQTAAMRANANALGAGAHAMFAGDFNMDSNTEAAWQNLVSGAGEGLAVDPINQSNASQTWNNNSSFAAIHTQSTRTGNTPDNDGGATGGLDDRFDVQLVTNELLDGEGLSFVPGSYRAFGNDGLHFNASINASPTIPLGATVANALWDGSDHLPVVADYQLPAKLSASQVFAAPAQVIVGAAASAEFNIRNTAPVNTPNAADELDYTLTSSGAAVGSFSGIVNAGTLAAGGVNRVVSLNTATPGLKVGTVSINTTSQGAETPSASFPVSTTVFTHASPSFDSSVSQLARTIDFGIVALGGSTQSVPVSIFNLPTSSFTARFDLDSRTATGDTAAFSVNILPVTDTNGFENAPASLTPGAIGIFSATFTFNVSDVDLPGAIALPSLVLNLTGRVARGGDANLSGTVDIADFSIVAANFNAPGMTWHDGDFNRDGSVDIADFATLAGNFNRSDAPLPRGAALPEPAGLGVAVVGMGMLARRRRA